MKKSLILALIITIFCMSLTCYQVASDEIQANFLNGLFDITISL